MRGRIPFFPIFDGRANRCLREKGGKGVSENQELARASEEGKGVKIGEGGRKCDIYLLFGRRGVSAWLRRREGGEEEGGRRHSSFLFQT